VRSSSLRKALDAARSRGRIAAAVAGSLCFGLPATSSRAEEPALDGSALYAQRTCIACHGPDARTPILPEYPRLAGQSGPYLLQQMRDIKSGARSNGNTAAMRGVMHLVSDEELQVLADWLSSLH
jgi:cytochrome c